MSRTAAAQTALGRSLQGARRWLVPAAVVLCALVLLWACGGFRTVQATQGRLVLAEQQVTLARWVLVVHRIELVDGSPDDTPRVPTVRLSLRVTFTGEDSISGLSYRLVTVQAPDGPVGIDVDSSTDEDRSERSGEMDPDVAQELTLDFPWPTVPVPAPPILRVLIRDEQLSTPYLFAPEWSAAPNVSVHLDLPCPDQRKRR